jgi:CheY-like chemotaxis protein
MLGSRIALSSVCYTQTRSNKHLFFLDLGFVAAVGEQPPDLILLDINLPEMNGFEVCERLKADKNPASIPVIFLSALNSARISA